MKVTCRCGMVVSDHDNAMRENLKSHAHRDCLVNVALGSKLACLLVRKPAPPRPKHPNKHPSYGLWVGGCLLRLTPPPPKSCASSQKVGGCPSHPPPPVVKQRPVPHTRTHTYALVVSLACCHLSLAVMTRDAWSDFTECDFTFEVQPGVTLRTKMHLCHAEECITKICICCTVCLSVFHPHFTFIPLHTH